jgi:hypothetical protein
MRPGFCGIGQFYWVLSRQEYQHDPTDSFFWDFEDDRAALDPIQWIENSILVPESFEIKSSVFQDQDRPPDQPRIDAAITKWRTRHRVREVSPFIN